MHPAHWRLPARLPPGKHRYTESGHRSPRQHWPAATAYGRGATTVSISSSSTSGARRT